MDIQATDHRTDGVSDQPNKKTVTTSSDTLQAEADQSLASRYPAYANNPRVLAFLEREWTGWHGWESEPTTTLPEDIPDLIRVAFNIDLYESHEENEWSAAIEAQRELARLKATEAIESFIKMLRQPWSNDGSDDHRTEEFPILLCMIDKATIDPLKELIQDTEAEDYSRTVAMTAYRLLAEKYPEFRDQAVEIITTALKSYADNTPLANAFLIAALCDFRAVKSIDVIREAYAADIVDLSITGDIEDVELEFGLRKHRRTPRRNYLEESQPEKYKVIEDMAKMLNSPAFPEIYNSIGDGAKTTAQIRSTKTTSNKTKIRRNGPCPCGSGKKFKHCCLG